MYWSHFDGATNRRFVEGAGLRIRDAREQTVEEHGAPAPSPWLIAEKPKPAQ